MILQRRKSFVLIVAMWVLSFLTILALGVAANIRQKIVLIGKFDQHSRYAALLEAAVEFSAVTISQEMNRSGLMYTVLLKSTLHNNPAVFGRLDLSEDYASISYRTEEGEEFFGLIDEESKININLVKTPVLARLIEIVLSLPSDEARNLADSILDWRQYGESQAKGFFSDEYYSRLEFPYAKKDANYETLDELLLVKGMTKDYFLKLIPYVTIYGDGRVNINTVQSHVLFALGLEENVAYKLLEVRRGRDGMEATADDHMFRKTFDVATEVNSIIKLDPKEIFAIDSLNQLNLISTDSYFFSVEAQAHLAHQAFVKTVRAVVSARENRILYWKER